MHHEPGLEVAAGAIPGVTPEVEAGVAAGLVVRVAFRVDNQGPSPDLNLGGG